MDARKKRLAISRTVRNRICSQTRKLGGRGSAPPEANYKMSVKVADQINLDDISIGKHEIDVVSLRDDRSWTRVFIHDDGWVEAYGPRALVLIAAVVTLLARAKIAPNASLATLRTHSASILGLGRRANM